jgi:nucleotide-binding universal stress UspA family protein
MECNLSALSNEMRLLALRSVTTRYGLQKEIPVMQSKILVPLDGSPLAETVLPRAAALAQATSSVVVLTRVSAPVMVAPPTAWTIPTPLIGYENTLHDMDLARDYLTDVALRLKNAGVVVETTGLDGDPAASIVAYTEEHPEVTMIAMATHGRSGLSRWVLGSVAEKVLHAAPVPLLLVRPNGPLDPAAPLPDIRTILVPLDGSIFAEQALESAYGIARTTGAALLLVSALPVPDDMAATDSGMTPSPVAVQYEAEAAQLTGYLEQQVQRLRMAGLVVETQIVNGHPADAILRAGAAAHADLIVMATHGRSGLQRLWLGSVAMKVVQGATLPVLLVRAREAAVPAAPPA